MAAASARNLVLRYLTFIVGIFVMAIGIAMTVHARIGTTPVSAIPLVMSYATPFTIGFYTVVINAVLLLAQILVLRRRFEPIQLLQLPAAFVFGGFCDLAVWLLEGFQPEFYLWQLLYSVAGSVVLGIGVWLQVTPRVLMLAGDGISAAISQVTGREFGSVKIVIDSLLVATAAVLSLVLLGGLVGVREGTFVSAFLVGYVVRLLQRRVPWPAALRRPESAAHD
ncbi:MAG: YitT family protein [Microbacteriaceae bacterium]|nr:YitT family protein [Microbacteriaceae bacterium]